MKVNSAAMVTAPIEAEFVDERPHASLAELEEYRDSAALFAIETQEDRATASEVIATLKRAAKALEEEELAATRPLMATLAKIRGWFAPARKAAQDARKAWDGAVLASDQRRRLEAGQAAQLVQEALAVGDVATAQAAHTLVNPPAPTEGLQVRRNWVAIVIAPDLLPREYLVPDQKKINEAMRAAVKETGEPPVIPGVKFKQEERLASTG